MANQGRRLVARDLMQDSVITLRPEMSLKQAAECFVTNGIGGAPVVSDEGELLGVLSQTDIVREASRDEFEEYINHGFYLGIPAFETGSFGGSDILESLTVEDAMSAYVISVTPDDPIAVLASLMRSHKFHRLIVAKNKKLVGIVSCLDLLKVLEDH